MQKYKKVTSYKPVIRKGETNEKGNNVFFLQKNNTVNFIFLPVHPDFCNFVRMEKFQIIKPSTSLSGYVKHYWFLEIDDFTPCTQRIAPIGSIELVFHRGKRMFSISEKSRQPQSFISGQTTEFFDIIPTGRLDMISVTFFPQGAKAFFALPLNEFRNQKIDMGLLNDPELNELQKKITETFDNRLCIQLIEEFLLSRLNSLNTYNHKRMLNVVSAINLGEDSMKKLADLSCLSYKQFQRIFSAYIGTNPKEFLRVVRYQRALYILQQHPGINLGQLAFDCDYYDESHLIKDFKQFSGYTPTEYMAVCAPYSDYFSAG